MVTRSFSTVLMKVSLNQVVKFALKAVAPAPLERFSTVPGCP